MNMHVLCVNVCAVCVCVNVRAFCMVCVNVRAFWVNVCVVCVNVHAVCVNVCAVCVNVCAVCVKVHAVYMIVKLFITNSRVVRKMLGPKVGGWGCERLGAWEFCMIRSFKACFL